jgi:hypothetical protein
MPFADVGAVRLFYTDEGTGINRSCSSMAGHGLHQERPGEFNSLVLNWIGGLPEAEAVSVPSDW